MVVSAEIIHAAVALVFWKEIPLSVGLATAVKYALLATETAKVCEKKSTLELHAMKVLPPCVRKSATHL